MGARDNVSQQGAPRTKASSADEPKRMPMQGAAWRDLATIAKMRGEALELQSTGHLCVPMDAAAQALPVCIEMQWPLSSRPGPPLIYRRGQYSTCMASSVARLSSGYRGCKKRRMYSERGEANAAGESDALEYILHVVQKVGGTYEHSSRDVLICQHAPSVLAGNRDDFE
ncbi:hypothetical protein COCMIDRAFT_26911 [Bipolaris oryzae ATCC 44560]|uniref:Uncharacterized protein n=1 Tax=Bipolaris oryzae ATCC 44560 TaxID=930090 RepID=W6Z517_COCMI|nr:uncharacterized protein COCMIDRAFT_26911 [Bipolaris oryzae ATCC 44560]EUC44853.1 hypothetical protein COCMIDRAFT_26911 [Bipolaris oryzae ATCC 44560]